MKLTRRGFFGACVAFLGSIGFGGTLGGCGDPIAYELRVSSLDNGASVYQATARYYELRVSSRLLNGHRKVVSVGGMRSDSWIFEINGQEFNGRADSAHGTRVRAGDLVTWRVV